jgi:hypothetical protein
MIIAMDDILRTLRGRLRFIHNSNKENAKYFYVKLNFYFQLAFKSSFKSIYEKLKDHENEFYYMTINNMERVRFILSEYQSQEQKLFITEQKKIAKNKQVHEDLEAIKGEGQG